MRTEEGLLLLNERGKILWANPAAAELLGFSREELCQLSLPLVGEQTPPSVSVATQRIQLTPVVNRGQSVAKVPTAIAAPPVGPVATAFRSIFAGELEEAEGAARIPDRNEKRIAVHWRLWSLPIQPGGKQRVLFAFSETAQATEEGPITSSYRDVFEHAVEGIYRSTLEGRLLEVNPALARMCGYETPAEMMDRVRDLNTEYYLRPNRRAEFLIAIQESGSVAGFESETFRADGSVFWAAEFGRVVTDEAGVPIYFEGSVIDISKRKQVESALRLSEEKFRTLVETTRVIPFEFHLSTQQFAYVGPQAESIFQCSIGARLTLQRWASLLHPDDREAGTRFATASLEKVPADYQIEFRVRAPSGGDIWIKQLVHFDYTDHEVGPLVRGFFLEITEAKMLEAERENSRIQLRDLAARLERVREDERTAIAGEIHDEVGQALTLLNIDLSLIKTRVARPLTDEERAHLGERLSAMETKIEGAFETVRRILLALRPPLLDALGLKDAVEFHLEEVAKRIGIRWDLDAMEVTRLNIDDRIVVFRIFQEALTNVAKHSKASRVKVCLSQSDDEFTLIVEDNGCGIAEEKLRNSSELGIVGIKERAVALGGTLAITAAAGGGTAVTLKIALKRDDGAEAAVD